jgi:hypothetical protein
VPVVRALGGWRLGDGRYECGGCKRRTSVTAGTIFDRTRTPLTVWFTACWLFATQKDGISAQSQPEVLRSGDSAQLGPLANGNVEPSENAHEGFLTLIFAEAERPT